MLRNAQEQCRADTRGQIEALDAVALTWPRLVDTVGARQAKADGARRLDSPSCVMWVRRQRSEVVGDTHG